MAVMETQNIEVPFTLNTTETDNFVCNKNCKIEMGELFITKKKAEKRITLL